MIFRRQETDEAWQDGDSGGPIFFDVPDMGLIQIGVVKGGTSFGFRVNCSGRLLRFTTISNGLK